MKMKALLSSLLTISLCLSLIAGSTFALFTDESKLNIAVTSGKVKLTAGIEGLDTFSLGDDRTAGRGGSFATGGTASFENGCLTLDRIVPGDAVTFRVVGKNDSNVTIQYRLRLACLEGEKLMSVLKVTIGNTTVTGLAAYTGAYITLAPDADMTAVPITVELPEGVGNDYQGLTAGINVTVEAVQGNADVTSEERFDTLVTTKEALESALRAGNDVTLLSDITVGGNLSLAAGATLNGNGHTLKNVQLYLNDGATVKDTVFLGTQAENGSHIYAHDVSVTLDGCTFDSPNWDAIQFTTETPNRVLTVENCCFKNTSGTAYRYIHAEVTDTALKGDAQNGVKVVLLNNHFGSIDTCTNDGITVAGVYESNVTLSHNTASANTEAAAEAECWFGVYNGSWHQYSVTAFSTVYPNLNALLAALDRGEDVVLGEDISTKAAQTAPYGNKAGLIHKRGVFDGNGKTVGITDDGDHYALMTSGGTIKNMIVNDGFRGIMIMSPTQDIVLDNVVSGGDVCYALNTGEGNGDCSLIVTNSTFNGWSSFANIKDASFTNCRFGQGDYYTNVSGRVVKPYVTTVFDSCEFDSKFYIDLSSLGENAKITLKNCTVNGVLLTNDNIDELIVPENECGEGQITIESRTGTYVRADWQSYVIIE